MSQTLDEVVNTLIKKTQGRLNVALPLGLGKANALINELYKRAKANPAIHLNIYTAISLTPPQLPDAEAAARTLKPILESLYRNCPILDYETDSIHNRLPDNIHVYEFFYAPGSKLGNAKAQQHYFYSNYTHVARDILMQDINVVVQMVVKDSSGTKVSLSCNSDVTLELISRCQDHKSKIYFIAEVNPNLPYMYGDAEMETAFFDSILEPEAEPQQLFSIPQKPVSLTDYAIALHVSTFVHDGGTLQIGLGCLGDAIAACLSLRHEHNEIYQQMLVQLEACDHSKINSNSQQELGPFKRGLYSSTEMLVEGLVFLMQKKILKRSVYPLAGLNKIVRHRNESDTIDESLYLDLFESKVIQFPIRPQELQALKDVGLFPTTISLNDRLEFKDQDQIWPQTQQNFLQIVKPLYGRTLESGCICHAGFFLGSSRLYQSLHDLSTAEKRKINMTAIGYVNHLYGNEFLKRDQRYNASFINTGMILTLTGAVVADKLEDAKVVSGVGGQYNFVAQAQELEQARSIICFRSTRYSHGQVQSNIVWQYSHVTVPAHLRDLVATEYGVADLRGASDRDVICKILNITDSRFQQELLHQAKKQNKVEKNYQIPRAYRENYPKKITTQLNPFLKYLPYFPLGSDFNEENAKTIVAMARLQHLKDVKQKVYYLRSQITLPKILQLKNKLQIRDLFSLPENALFSILMASALNDLEHDTRPLF